MFGSSAETPLPSEPVPMSVPLMSATVNLAPCSMSSSIQAHGVPSTTSRPAPKRRAVAESNDVSMTNWPEIVGAGGNVVEIMVDAGVASSVWVRLWIRNQAETLARTRPATTTAKAIPPPLRDFAGALRVRSFPAH
jgi:hypothetical protein